MPLGDKTKQVLRGLKDPFAKIILKRVIVSCENLDVSENEYFALQNRINAPAGLRDQFEQVKGLRSALERTIPYRDEAPFPVYRGDGSLTKVNFPENSKSPMEATQGSLAEYDLEMDELTSSIETATKRFAHVGPRRAAYAARLRRCDTAFAELVRSGVKIEFESPRQIDRPPKDLERQIQRDVEMITEKRAIRREVMAAKIDMATAKLIITAEVHRLAGDGRPALGPLLGRHGGVYWQGRESQDGTHVPDAVGLAAWLDPEKMIAALHRDLVAEYKEMPLSFTDDQRAQRLLEIDAEILEAERHAEELTWFALEAHIDIIPRPDADVRAMLGLIDGAPVRAREAA